MVRVRQTAFIALVAVSSACRGSGEGQITGTVIIPLCNMNAAYDLGPTFFQTYRTGPQLVVRISRGGGELDFTDSMFFVFPNTERIAAALSASTTVDAMGQKVVDIPVGSEQNGALVTVYFNPNWSCGRHRATRLGQAVSVWSYAGTVQIRSIDRGSLATSDAERITDVPSFTVQLHDPRIIGSTSIFAPADIDKSGPVGPDGTQFSGWFKFHHSSQPPAELFP